MNATLAWLSRGLVEQPVSVITVKVLDAATTTGKAFLTFREEGKAGAVYLLAMEREGMVQLTEVGRDLLTFVVASGRWGEKGEERVVEVTFHRDLNPLAFARQMARNLEDIEVAEDPRWKRFECSLSSPQMRRRMVAT